jgi:endoglucanase
VGVHELALGKPALASSTQTSNVAASGNDGNLATRWCAVNGSYPQWWRVDLGAAYSLSKFSVQFEHPERTYGYTIETSPDDKLYTLQATLSGKGAVQSSDFRAGVSGRYLRITVTSGDVWMDANGTHNPWASFFEFSVTGS